MNLKKLAPIMIAGLLPLQAMAFPWSIDMVNQPSVKPQEGTPAPFPVRSIPVSGIPTTIKDRQEADKLKNPVPATAASIKQGKKLFKIICGACHGLDGTAKNPVGERIGAIDLTSSYVQESLSEGWLWGTITFGSAIMPAYGKPSGRDDLTGSNDLSPEERWHVVNYIRKQLAKDAAMSATASAQ